MRFFKDIANLSRSEKIFVLLSMLTLFCINAEYSISRSASQSYFLEVFSSQSFPIVWLATVPLNLAIVTLYNKLLPKFGALRMMLFICAAIVGIHTLCARLIPFFPQLIFFHYCWKDIYILLMFQQLWSMIHSTIQANRAKNLYGLIFAVGTIGGICGSLVTSLFAAQFGSLHLLYFAIPIYSLLLLAYSFAYRLSGATQLTSSIEPQQTRSRDAFLLFKRNHYLFAILMLVIFMQTSVGIIEYQFNHHLELAIPTLDTRTAYFGQTISIILAISFLFQLIGGMLISLLGLRYSHFFIPLALACMAIGQWSFPAFAIATAAFICTKSMDYSLFGIIREMLFVPLKLDEKFRAKSIIDVFGHRTSKALISIIILGLQWIAGTSTFSYVSYLSFAIFCAWLFVVSVMFYKYYPQQTQTSSENLP